MLDTKDNLEESLPDLSLDLWRNFYAQGSFNNPSDLTQIVAGWCRWYIPRGELGSRTKLLAPKVFDLAEVKAFNPNAVGVKFATSKAGIKKYNIIFLYDLIAGRKIYRISLLSGRAYRVTYYCANGKETCHDFSSWKGVINFFNIV